MSEITAISKIKPIRPKEYQNQHNIIDEQTNESVTQNQTQPPYLPNADRNNYEDIMDNKDTSEGKDNNKMKFLDQLIAQNKSMETDNLPTLKAYNRIRKINQKITPIN